MDKKVTTKISKSHSEQKAFNGHEFRFLTLFDL